MIELRVNGATVSVADDPATPLLWVLRDRLNLTGTKYGCGAGLCGACTVLVDRRRADRSCQLTLGEVAGAEVTTIEGLAGTIGVAAQLQQAWIAEQVPQCGYCQPGMIAAATALLIASPHPSDVEIDAAITNICRCGTYPRIRRAIHRAAGTLAEKGAANG
jgi:isoquinoline 1-oxidoreductase alpha subunit